MKIGILGGGTAGYLTALAFHRHLPDVQVEVIAASDIPPIGVGESTFPQIVSFLHDYLGLEREPFYQAVQPTWKLGTRFLWGLPGDNHAFNFPFDTTNHKAAHGKAVDLRRGSMMAVLMDDERSFMLPRADGGHKPITKTKYAYQLDNRRFIAYLRDQVAHAGIPLIDAQIQRIDVDDEKQRVIGLHAADGRSFTYDLYVDCSGFRSVLLEGALDVPFVTYRSSLFVDSAIIGSLPNNGRVRPYTAAQTMNNGWMWLISMREEDHLGYVFSGSHCSTEQAVEEFEGKTGVKAHSHVLRFPSGRHERQWKGNVVAIGNSFAFVEPLQATGIQMILSSIRSAINLLNGKQDRAVAIDRYNETMNEKWDFLRGFLAMHYRFNKRIDSPFWQDCRSEVELAGIEPLVDYFHQHGLLSLADEQTRAGFSQLWNAGLFGTNGMDLILLGQGERPGRTPPVMEESWFRKKRTVWDQLSKDALTQFEALQVVERRMDLLV